MAKIGVIYDYIEDKISPMKMVIRFSQGEIDWTRNQMYVPIQTPFQRFDQYDFNLELPAISVHMEDLIVNQDKPGFFGINLKTIRERVGYIHEVIRVFFIQMSDIEDVLEMDIHQFFDWR